GLAEIGTCTPESTTNHAKLCSRRNAGARSLALYKTPPSRYHKLLPRTQRRLARTWCQELEFVDRPEQALNRTSLRNANELRLCWGELDLCRPRRSFPFSDRLCPGLIVR